MFAGLPDPERLVRDQERLLMTLGVALPRFAPALSTMGTFQRAPPAIWRRPRPSDAMPSTGSPRAAPNGAARGRSSR